MKRVLIIVVFFVPLLFAFRKGGEEDFVKDNLARASAQLKLLLQAQPSGSLRFPRTIDAKGNLVTTSMYDWTPGFFPGSLWYAYESTGDPALKEAAREWTEKLQTLQTFTEHHDLGFMMYCSYGNAYRITGNNTYRDILVRSAQSLSTRFNPVTGCIKSWNIFKSWHGDKSYYFPVIIDNMMNLELLFFASRVTGDTMYRHIAVSHALQTLRNQIRPDYSSYHVVCYDTTTGKVLARETAQGYADNSTWSRGQAWAIYGFTMVYRETHDPRFLVAARGLANYFLHNPWLPADKVPYWDFNANQPGYQSGKNSYADMMPTLYRDASAAAITASALLELSTYVKEKKDEYRGAAIQMLHTLSGPAYRADDNTNGNFLLEHCVGSIPHNAEIDVPLVYADYYYMEALERYSRLLRGRPLFGKN